MLLVAGFVFWTHAGSGVPAFRAEPPPQPGWERFKRDYGVSYFGDDGQFVRAVQNGYNLVYHTAEYAPRFTRIAPGGVVRACADCHSVEDLAYSFVNSDRYDARFGRRMSFEDHVRHCYAASLDGAVPTIYDPAVRDIRLLARAVAHHLQLGEGAMRK